MRGHDDVDTLREQGLGLQSCGFAQELRGVGLVALSGRVLFVSFRRLYSQGGRTVAFYLKLAAK